MNRLRTTRGWLAGRLGKISKSVLGERVPLRYGSPAPGHRVVLHYGAAVAPALNASLREARGKAWSKVDDKRGRRGERRNRKRTFEWDNDDFLLAIPTPLLDLTERIDKHARINDDDIGLLGTRLLGVLGPTPLRCGRTLLLLVLVLLMGLCGCDPDTADGKLASLRII